MYFYNICIYIYIYIFFFFLKGKRKERKRKPLGEGNDCIGQARILFHSQWGVGIFVYIVFIDHTNKIDTESCRREQSREKDQSNGSVDEQGQEGRSKTWGSYLLL